MPESAGTPPGAEELIARGDALYRPFARFAEWLSCRIDAAAWTTAVSQLADASSQPGVDAALETIRRAAAIDTGAIENLYTTDLGFTLTVAAQLGAWEEALEARGHQVRRTIEDQITAYDRLIDLIKEPQPLTEAALRNVHAAVCRSQETYAVEVPLGTDTLRTERRFVKGQYKDHPNHVLKPGGEILAFAPVQQTPIEMHRFIEEMRSPSFEAAHPVLQAAFAHHAFVTIHPFADGNGRMARLLGSFFLLKAHGVPLLIFAAERAVYLEALRAGDRGDRQPWVDFVALHGLDAMRLVRERLALPSAHSFVDSVRKLLPQRATEGTARPESVEDAARVLLRTFQEEFARLVDTAKGAFARSGTTDVAGGSFPSQPRYGRLESSYGSFRYELQSHEPGTRRVSGAVQAEVPEVPPGAPDVILTWSATLPEGRPEVLYRCSIVEALGGTTPARRLSLSMSAEALLGRILKGLAG